MGYANNIYHYPEKHGLRIVSELDWSSGNYEFDLTVVWEDEDGKLYMGEDSGCSCPGTFDGYESLDELTPITFHELAEHLNKRFASGDGRYGYVNEASIVDMLSRIRNLGSTW